MSVSAAVESWKMRGIFLVINKRNRATHKRWLTNQPTVPMCLAVCTGAHSFRSKEERLTASRTHISSWRSSSNRRWARRIRLPRTKRSTRCRRWCWPSSEAATGATTPTSSRRLRRNPRCGSYLMLLNEPYLFETITPMQGLQSGGQWFICNERYGGNTLNCEWKVGFKLVQVLLTIWAFLTVLYPYLHLSANGERFDSADSLRDAVAFRKGLPSGAKATLGQGNTNTPYKYQILSHSYILSLHNINISVS